MPPANKGKGKSMNCKVRYYNREREQFETITIKNVNYITTYAKDEKTIDTITIIYKCTKTLSIPAIDLLYINQFE